MNKFSHSTGDCAVSGAPAHQAFAPGNQIKASCKGLLKPITGLGLELLDIGVGAPRVMTQRTS
jgi:hypothetical protein